MLRITEKQHVKTNYGIGKHRRSTKRRLRRQRRLAHKAPAKVCTVSYPKRYTPGKEASE
jgi:hypothetical protein